MLIKRSSLCPQTAISDENEVWKGEVFIARCSLVAAVCFSLTDSVSDIKEKTGIVFPGAVIVLTNSREEFVVCLLYLF